MFCFLSLHTDFHNGLLIYIPITMCYGLFFSFSLGLFVFNLFDIVHSSWSEVISDVHFSTGIGEIDNRETV